MKKTYVEYESGNIGVARKKQKEIYDEYGYKPTMFKVTSPITNRDKFVVVKPYGLRKK